MDFNRFSGHFYRPFKSRFRNNKKLILYHVQICPTLMPLMTQLKDGIIRPKCTGKNETKKSIKQNQPKSAEVELLGNLIKAVRQAGFSSRL